MELSNDLISMFAKITNDGGSIEEVDTTLYGTIVDSDGNLFVKLDGSGELTPMVATATVKANQRVAVTIKNHSAIVIGNISDPSASSDDLNGVHMQMNDVATMSSLANGSAVIDASCIKTGSIGINRLNLTGSITYSDLSPAIMEDIEECIDTANSAKKNATTALTRANEAYSLAESIAIPSYIKPTYIESILIKSPKIYGGESSITGSFQAKDSTSAISGYMGSAKGLDAVGSNTYGVALSNSWNSTSYAVGDKYVIVTNSGVRLQAGRNYITITDNGINITVGNGKAYYNGAEISTV